jgi:predicted N-acyltransferase
VGDFLTRERRAVAEQIHQLMQHSPYRQAG